jgi:hypothetical protein
MPIHSYDELYVTLGDEGRAGEEGMTALVNNPC